MHQDRTFGFSTRALHAGTSPDPATGARAAPLYMSSSFVFDSAEHAAELFSLRSYGTIYSRISNPTVAAFEEKIASLEGGLGAVATASGQAAQLVAILTLAQAGDHIVASSNLYGGTVTQFSVTLKRMGIDVTFVPNSDPAAMRGAIRPNSKALYAETIGNPLGNVADIRALAEVAHGAGLPLIIDNTFASPYLCRPIEHGADIVVHSATKFLSGNGTLIGGVLVESGKFDWNAGKHPLIGAPSPAYHGMSFAETFGEFAFLCRARLEVLRDVGACMSPMNAWLLILGLETLAVRMRQHVANAVRVADFLEHQDGVAWVKYAGLRSSDQHELADKYLQRGAGSIFTFGVRGGREAGVRFIDSLRLWSHLANVGDAKSLVIHPGSTTHQQLSDEEMIAAGITPDMVRLSVGIEDAEDLIWDLEQALAAAQTVALAQTGAGL
ncbi:MAG: O-acetylhomoserine aminocarboxypropyltransferase/cysteine synthase [Candidatus Eremiobacteraeota bacterium]|nr:O-acetylhomoserine aminocarboxypropyltransferase/cysteine synthase [Candidatus Eremiobacteraeota bacterium]MBV8364926.1 O-acetylhomoserine aminocarboxypropyltransferase/cysteine synthase [Candidatus Eremiobacteraeota bacterium]